MKLPQALIFLLLLMSCKSTPHGWSVLDFGVFKIKVPAGWNKIKEQGVDSYVGGITNKKDTLWFDYGWYGVNLKNGSASGKLAIDTVNGLLAEISIPADTSNGYLSMRINHVNKSDKFTIYGSRINLDTGLTIFKSVLFKESDTTKNPPLTWDKFSNQFSQSGEFLFKTNCASCHRIDHDFTGPALFERFSLRSRDWVYQFLTKRNENKPDSSEKENIKKYGFKCSVFPELKANDVYAIYD